MKTKAYVLRKGKNRVTCTAKDVADMLTKMGWKIILVIETVIIPEGEWNK